MTALGPKHGVGPLALAVIVALSSPGCAHRRGRAVKPAEPEDTRVGLTRAEPSGAQNHHKRKNRFVLDPSKVLAVQQEEIQSQQVEYEDDRPWGINRFTTFLDRTHEGIYRNLDNAVRRLDTMWLPEGVDYDYQSSSFRLRLMTRAGGRGNEGDFNVKARFNTRLSLPGLERELYVFVDNTGRDDLPGSDPLDQESDTRVGLRSVRNILKDSKLDLSGGVRFRSARAVLYADARVTKRWKPDPWDIRLAPSVFYYSDDGFGQMAALTLTRPVGDNRAIQFRTVERSTESTQGFEFEQTVRFAWYRSGRKRGWVAQASAFPHHKHSAMYWDNAMVNISWRDALYKKWVYFTLTPQVDFAREDDYDPHPSLRIGVEILFGGQPADLM